MKDLKFRAWDKKYREWIKITPMADEAIYCEFKESEKSSPEQRILDGKTGKNIFLTLDGLIVSICPEGRLKTSIRNESSRYVLVQWTGLKDKNGKELYEDDILQWKSFYYRVYYNEHIAAYGLIAQGVEAGFSYPTWKEAEYAGNAHENPELLEGK